MVGARNEDEDVLGLNTVNASGSAYIYELNETSGDWFFKQKIVASDRKIAARFGFSVDSHDSTIVVGAGSSFNTYVFEKGTNGNWSESQTVRYPQETKSSNNFGYSVSITDTKMAISAIFESFDLDGPNEVIQSGAVYLYDKNDLGTWDLTTKVIADSQEQSGAFARSVAVSENFVLCGHPQNKTDENGLNDVVLAGAVLIFKPCDDATTSSLSIDARDSYTTPSGKILTASGEYRDTIPNSAGCDSIITVTFNRTNADTTVQVDKNTLTAVDLNSTYEWFNCESSAVVKGENDQTFVAKTSGSFSLILSKDGCVDTTACVQIVISGVNDQVNSSFKFYPTLANNTVVLSSIKNGKYTITDLSGSLMLSGLKVNPQEIIPVSGLRSGVYLFRFDREVIKFSKQ